ncbi:cation-translocating P-type ATPase [Dongia sp.]|uniref:cation-translocating P-type ATPase n=1 Tax=Dongia sp. TaxID=1977262 RepID=UPI00375073DB
MASGETPAGLTAAEAAERLRRFGPNALADPDHRNLARLVLEVLREPMFLMLVVAAGLYLLLGDLGEGLLLGGFAIINLGLVAGQEWRTERVLESLRDLSSPRALVIRDGREQRIAGREVVPGDLVILAEGDRVPADGRLIACRDLQIDESLLTGESVPVRKQAGSETEAAVPPGGDDLPFVYSGTLVVKGQGLAEVVATGARSEIGKIGVRLATLAPEPTLIQQATARLVQRFAVFGIGVSALVFLLYTALRGGWLEGILAGLTVAMSMLPEEFPMVLTVFLALGALRLSRQKVLTRRAAAIESLGAASILCVDKTGTLTENRMTVACLYAEGGFHDVAPGATALPEPFHGVAEFAILASKRHPFDPMELAMQRLGQGTLGGTEHLHPAWAMVREYELQPGFLAMTRVWDADPVDPSDGYVLAAKGAPEAIVDLCHLPEAERRTVDDAVRAMAGRGLRVIAVARGHTLQGTLPSLQHDLDFAFVGLVGLADPLRADAAVAIAECREAGIAVAMITGDFAATATAIGRQAGLERADHVLTGPELAQLDDRALAERIAGTRIFARILPEQKLRLVEAFKARGDVVAMTGDGVNDAPALKAAHIGVAMGGRGSDVAREAASVVLLDDNFAALVAAVAQGRRIFDNLRKAMVFIVAVHVPIAGLALLPLAFGWPLLLFPAHVVFLEMLIDPICSIVLEAEPAERDSMRRPPRRRDEPILARRGLLWGVVQGAAALLSILALYAWSLGQGMSEDAARGLAFTALIAANVFLVLVNRAWGSAPFRGFLRPNPALFAVVAAAAVALGMVLYVPMLERLFHFEAPEPGLLLLALGIGAGSVAWFEFLKPLRRGR